MKLDLTKKLVKSGIMFVTGFIVGGSLGTAIGTRAKNKEKAERIRAQDMLERSVTVGEKLQEENELLKQRGE